MRLPIRIPPFGSWTGICLPWTRPSDMFSNPRKPRTIVKAIVAVVAKHSLLYEENVTELIEDRQTSTIVQFSVEFEY